MHKHKCKTCGTIWAHGNEIGNEAAHSCPKCGRVQWFKYFGDKGFKMEMLGIDLIGADKKGKKADKPAASGSAFMDKVKANATYVGAALGALVGVLAMAYTGKHAGSRWTGRTSLPLLHKPVSGLVKNGIGAVVGGAAAGVGAHYLKQHEGW